MSYMLGMPPKNRYKRNGHPRPTEPTLRTGNRDPPSSYHPPARLPLTPRDKHLRQRHPPDRLIPLWACSSNHVGQRGEQSRGAGRKRTRLAVDEALDHPGQAFLPSQLTTPPLPARSSRTEP